MKILGQTDFLSYMYAEKTYDEIIIEHRMKLHRVYRDVAPTMIGFDYDGGRMYSCSINVEDYVIGIVELRESLEKERKNQFNKVCIYRRAFSRLEPYEQAMIEQYKTNGLITPIKGIQAILERFKGMLENEIAKQDMKQVPVSKPIAMSDVILFERIEKHKQDGRKQYLVDGVFTYMTEREYAAYQQQSENHLWLVEN